MVVIYSFADTEKVIKKAMRQLKNPMENPSIFSKTCISNNVYNAYAPFNQHTIEICHNGQMTHDIMLLGSVELNKKDSESFDTFSKRVDGIEALGMCKTRFKDKEFNRAMLDCSFFTSVLERPHEPTTIDTAIKTLFDQAKKMFK